MLSWTQVRDELVAAVRMSWRMPGAGLGSSGGRATDGPWHLLTRVVRASAGASDRAGADKWEALRNEIERQQVSDLRNSPRTVPLMPEEVTWMEQRIEWLLMVPERDRKLVWLALVQLAGGRDQVEWAKVRRWVPVESGRFGLYRRFVRALQGVAKGLNTEAAKAIA